VEGWDLEILKSIDFETYRPEVICIESVTFSLTNNENKISGMVEFITSKGYFVYADTHINTLFCDMAAFEKAKTQY
jgi:hypothetical protein